MITVIKIDDYKYANERSHEIKKRAVILIWCFSVHCLKEFLKKTPETPELSMLFMVPYSEDEIVVMYKTKVIGNVYLSRDLYDSISGKVTVKFDDLI